MWNILNWIWEARTKSEIKIAEDKYKEVKSPQKVSLSKSVEKIMKSRNTNENIRNVNNNGGN